MKSGVGRVWTTLASAIEDTAATLLESRGYAVIELPAARGSGSWNFFGSFQTARALWAAVSIYMAPGLRPPRLANKLPHFSPRLYVRKGSIDGVDENHVC